MTQAIYARSTSCELELVRGNDVGHRMFGDLIMV